jgi:hypothetical protein
VRPGRLPLLLEEELRAYPKPVQIAGKLAGGGIKTIVVQVLELKLDVGVQIPIHAQFKPVQLPTANGTVVQIQVRPASSKFPGAAAEAVTAAVPSGSPEGSVRTGDIGAAQSA